MTLSPSNAVKVQGVAYRVGFTTSSTGGLGQDGTITVGFPAATTIADNWTAEDVTTGQSAGGAATITGSTVQLSTPLQIASGDKVLITFHDVTNAPTTGTKTVTVSTSSDTGTATASFSLVPRDPIPAQATVTLFPASDINVTGVSYAVEFTTSANGGLTPYSTITVGFPAGTTIADNWTAEDVTTGQSAGGAATITGSTVQLSTPLQIASGDKVLITFHDVTNAPTTGTKTVTVSTSSDTGTATASFTLSKVYEIVGTAKYQTSGGPAPVVGSVVQACTASTCASAIAPADSQGKYTIYVTSPGVYTVTAFAPTSDADSLGQGTAQATVVRTGTVTTNVTLPAIAAPPAGESFGGATGTVPVVGWQSPAPLSVQACAHGAGVALISSLNEQTGGPDLTFGGLAESSARSTTYAGTVPPLYPSHGTATIDATAQCAPSSALLPASGPSSGGTAVQISGSGFTGATAVKFGSKAAASFTVVAGSLIDAVAPAGSGTVAVTVTTPHGTVSSATLASYAYLTVGSVQPRTGPDAGGTTVTIDGSGFGNVQAVYFGNSAASDVVVVSGTQITATAPPGKGSAPVTVLTTDGGESSATGPAFGYGGAAASRAPVRQTARTLPLPALAAPHPAADRAAGSPPAFAAVTPDQQLVAATANIVQHAMDACDLTAAECAAYDNAMATGFGQVTNVLDPGWISIATTGSTLTLAYVAAILAGLAAGPIAAALLAAAALAAGMAVYNALNEPDVYDYPGHLPGQYTHCVDGTCTTYPSQQPFQARIDPSGTVENTSGGPVSGATVTLLQSDSALGPFTAPATGSPIMSPSVNPETSDSGGAFDWDVFAGYYEITAAKSGCYAPGHPARGTVATPVFQVPPPRTGIVLTLDCPGAPKAKAPKVTGLSLSSATAAGGAQLEIAGTGFTTAAAVRFGTVKAKTVKVLSPTSISVTTPAGTGTVNVTVQTAAGTSKTSAADRFTFIAAPALSRISPAKGPAKGGTRVVITGKGFAAGDGVAFGTAAAGSATVVSGTEIIAVTPPGHGTVHVTVAGPGGVSTRVVSFAYPKLAQTIKFTAPATGTVGKSVKLKATGGASGKPVVFTVASASAKKVCTVSGTHGTKLTYKKAGKCVIDANQAGTARYAAGQVRRTITVRKHATKVTAALRALTTVQRSGGPSIRQPLDI